MTLALPIFAEIIMIIWFVTLFYKKDIVLSKFVLMITYLCISPYLVHISFKLGDEPILMKLVTGGVFLWIFVHVVVESVRYIRKKVKVPYPGKNNIYAMVYFFLYTLFSTYVIVRKLQQPTEKEDDEEEIKSYWTL